MVEQLQRNPSQQGSERNEINISMPVEPQCCTRKWYFSREEIEDHSPSRKDGIDLKKESRLRKLYCSFLQELGMTLKVPQVSIANAIMLCHQFYMRQSHAKNDWQTIATVSMFLGCKIEDTLRLRKDVVIAAYEILHKRDPSAGERIRQKEVYNKHQELLLIGERLLLATIAFDLDIQLPYKPLVAALKRLELGHDIPRVAWNFVNDWLCTTLCLQYKPHYIAAGSVFLAAKYQKVKLPTEKGKVWWLEFDISPKLLEEVIKRMLRLLEQDNRQTPAPKQERAVQPTPVVEKPIGSGPKSAISMSTVGRHSIDGAQVDTGGYSKLTSSNSGQNLACGGSIADFEVLPPQTSESGNAGSVVEDGDGENPPELGNSNQNSSCKIVSVENRAGGSDQNSSCNIDSLHQKTGSVVEDGDNKNPPGTEDPDQNSSFKAVADHNRAGSPHRTSSHMIDAARIREALKRRRRENATNKKSVEVKIDEIDIETWIEIKLESEIELESDKKQRVGLSEIYNFE